MPFERHGKRKIRGLSAGCPGRRWDMKKGRWVILLAGFLMASCAGIPNPEKETDALVVGSLVLSYPDGFFGEPPRTLDSGIRLDFLNVTTQKEFWVVTTRGGWFTFLSNGGDRYQLTKYAYDLEISGKGTYSGGGGIKYKFMSSMGCVQYLGHFTVTYSRPRMTDTGSNSTGWRFDTGLDRANRPDEIRGYLQAAAKDSPWLTRDVRSDFPQS
jgi:hypothetical protein